MSLTLNFAALLGFGWQEPTPFDAAQYDGGTASFVWMLLQTVLALAFVCGLALLLFRWVLPRLQLTPSGANSMVRVVDRVMLDARRSLLVVEVAGRWLLVSSSEAGVQLISELDATEAVNAAEAIERLRPNLRDTTATTRDALAERFSRLLNKRK